MEEIAKKILYESGIKFENEEELNGMLIPREILLDITKYDNVKSQIPDLKKIFSSSVLTSLQKNAIINQKWPLLNLVRQILGMYGYNLTPVRKRDGYTLDGVKKFKRFFQVEKNIKNNKNQNVYNSEDSK
jgi:hypothetical protein